MKGVEDSGVSEGKMRGEDSDVSEGKMRGSG